MADLPAIIQSSTSHAWLYLPIAVVLGALHALEPGHAKSLMAAYIVAIKGTATQAVTLGVSTAVGHTIVVWLLAIAALAFGHQYIVDEAEPWITALSGVLIVLLAVRMFWLIRRSSGHSHGHDHGSSHQGHHHHHLDHNHAHDATSIASGSVTTGQIIWFGFTGGLIPCPAALAVLLVCVQLKAFALGVLMVVAFSVGVGATLVAIGLAVVWGSGKLSKAWPGFDRLTQRLPYFSAGLVMILGLVLTAAGLNNGGVLATRKPD